MKQARKRQLAANPAQAAREMGMLEKSMLERDKRKTEEADEDSSYGVLDMLDEATDWSLLKKDIKYIYNADPSKMTLAERNALARKYIQTADVGISSPSADIAVYFATYEDIQNADVSGLRKAGAHVVNGVGLFGAIPGWLGPIVDTAAYEAISQLLSPSDPEQETGGGW